MPPDISIPIDKNNVEIMLDKSNTKKNIPTAYDIGLLVTGGAHILAKLDIDLERDFPMPKDTLPEVEILIPPISPFEFLIPPM